MLITSCRVQRINLYPETCNAQRFFNRHTNLIFFAQTGGYWLCKLLRFIFTFGYIKL